MGFSGVITFTCTFLMITCNAKMDTFEKPQVHIIFEALCPASVNFIEANLKSNYSPILTDFIDIIFIPFGKAREDSGPDKFSCQHGPEECHLNRVMSCGLNFLKEQSQQVDYVVCSMKMREQWPECVEAANLPMGTVLNCYNETSMGLYLQTEASKLQEEVLGGFPTGVPTIVINWKSDDYWSRLAFDNFKKAICGVLEETVDTKWNHDLIQYCTPEITVIFN